MLYNKNNVRKTNDKKILHKVGKQWKVISTALLLAVAGGAVAATHANANADNVSDLEEQPNVQAPSYAANFQYSSAAPKSASKAPASVSYERSMTINGSLANNGSAASERDKAVSEYNIAHTNFNSVKGYIQSLNAEYAPQVNSLDGKISSASSASANDNKLAKSYSATAKKGTTTTVINSLAAKNSMDPTLYQGMVQDNEQAYSDAVSSASNDVKANSDVASLVNSLESINFTSASMSASASDVVASSNYVGAQANWNSLNAKWGHLTNGQNLTTAASELSYGAVELYADGNNVNYNANVASLGQLQGVNGASLTSQFNSDVASAYSSASNVFNTYAKNNQLSAYAAADNNGNTIYNYNLVYGKTAPALNSVANVEDRDNDNANYNAAVSAATDIRFAPVLASAANSVFASYGIQYGTYTARSREANSIMASASAEVSSASYALDFADANSFVVSSLSNDVQAHGASAAAHFYLNEGINAFANSLGLIVPNDKVNEDQFANQYVTDIITGAQNAENNNLNGALKAPANGGTDPRDGSNRKSQLDQVIAAGVNTLNNGNTSEIKNNVSQVTNWMNDLQKFSIPTGHSYMEGVNQYDADKNANSAEVKFQKAVVNAFFHYFNNNDNDAFDKAPTINSHTKFHGEYMQHIATAISDAMDKANSNLTTNIANATNDLNNQLANDRTTAFNRNAALLSAGVDVDALENESGAISNVANATNSAYTSLNSVSNNGERFGDALNVAASSANSALGSADNASASYSNANDEDVTLASYFASSYSTDANNESSAANTYKTSLDNFYKSMAGNTAFSTPFDKYVNANTAAENDATLAHAYGVNVYQHSPKYITTQKSVGLYNVNHGRYTFLTRVPAGQRLAVTGVQFGRTGQIRYVVSYNGKQGSVNSYPSYVKQTYLTAAPGNLVNIKVLNNSDVYSSLLDNGAGFGKRTGKSYKKGTVLNGVTVVSTDVYGGFSAVELSDGTYVSANIKYAQLEVPQNNQPSASAYNVPVAPASEGNNADAMFPWANK